MHTGVRVGGLCLGLSVFLAGCTQPGGRGKPIPPSKPPKDSTHNSTSHAPSSNGSMENVSYYQLTLMSEPAPEQVGRGLKYVHLEHSQAKPVGECLALMIIPSGPTGTLHRYALLYPTELEWTLAGEWAKRLDVGSATTESETMPTDINDRYAFGLSLYFATPRHHDQAQARYTLAAQALESVLLSQDQVKEQRWIAGIVAASIHIERLFENSKGLRLFGEADKLALPGSYEQMVTLYLEAGVLVQEGQQRDALGHLSRIISEFSAYRMTEIYDRARKLFGELSQP